MVPAQATAGRSVAAYAAATWVVVFVLAHVYWYSGGTLVRPTLPQATPGVFDAILILMAVVGLAAPLAAAQGWGRRLPARLLTAVLWAGCAVLLLRGLAGLVDELLRVTGVAAGGLTGLSLQQVTGFADPSQAVQWTGRAIDGYFTLGGLLFGAAAHTFRRGRNPAAQVTAG
ncbi:DUF3995 domain-containing protein, partial [Actinoplanes sp. NPDC051633]|uniref:DUF3995 domain-containing protein n=1 Tax=Actinoplanes sp. NPDC051633 TaxID=3155670 RepID=UPI0034285305